jgi:hypothetical protein
MLTPNEFLRNIIEKLQQAGIDYVICGSVAASFYGITRSTMDTDIIIDPTKEKLTKFIELLGNKYYVSSEAAFDALKEGAMFNVIDIDSSCKADLIIRKQTDFSDEEFRRKRKEKLLGKELYILSPEDSILSKLDWAKESRSETQYRDVMTILDAGTGQLDMKYLIKWAKILKVEDDLKQCVSKIKGL